MVLLSPKVIVKKLLTCTPMMIDSQFDNWNVIIPETRCGCVSVNMVHFSAYQSVGGISYIDILRAVFCELYHAAASNVLLFMW